MYKKLLLAVGILCAVPCHQVQGGVIGGVCYAFLTAANAAMAVFCGTKYNQVCKQESSLIVSRIEDLGFVTQQLKLDQQRRGAVTRDQLIDIRAQEIILNVKRIMRDNKRALLLSGTVCFGVLALYFGIKMFRSAFAGTADEKLVTRAQKVALV